MFTENQLNQFDHEFRERSEKIRKMTLSSLDNRQFNQQMKNIDAAGQRALAAIERLRVH